jgi:hypothetical protein
MTFLFLRGKRTWGSNRLAYIVLIRSFLEGREGGFMEGRREGKKYGEMGLDSVMGRVRLGVCEVI